MNKYTVYICVIVFIYHLNILFFHIFLYVYVYWPFCSWWQLFVYIVLVFSHLLVYITYSVLLQLYNTLFICVTMYYFLFFDFCFLFRYKAPNVYLSSLFLFYICFVIWTTKTQLSLKQCLYIKRASDFWYSLFIRFF